MVFIKKADRGISDPRNKALIKMFNMIDIGERAGSGVPDIFSVWSKQCWKVPIVEEQFNPERTILTLSFEKAAENQRKIKNSITNKRKDDICKYLEKNPDSKNTQIAAAIGLKEPRTRQLLAELISEGRVVIEGKSSSGQSNNL